MSDYIKQWLYIIENMHNTNTYKLAWGRALLELIVQLEEVNSENVFTFKQIGHKMLKYYWNQLYFFNLKQGPNPKKIPVIEQETRRCIEFYKKETNSSFPIWFDLAENVLKSNYKFYDSELNIIGKKLKDDVSYRFMNIKKEKILVYDLDLQNFTVTFSESQIKQLQEYAFVLSQLLNYRWAQLLENFNNCPKIASKVNGISGQQVKRNQLTKYKNILLSQMDENNIIDFYTGKVLKKNDISVDHVIPWSFMYSDDIWNLVLTSKSENSSKSNSIPSQEVIERLEKRNEQLLNRIGEESSFYDDLKMAVDNDYVQKFYLSLKM